MNGIGKNNTGGKRNAEVSYSKRFKVQHFQQLQTETIFKQEVCSVWNGNSQNTGWTCYFNAQQLSNYI